MTVKDSGPVRFGYVLITGALILAITLSTIVFISIAQSNAIGEVQRMHRVTLCILLTKPEDRTPLVVLDCDENTPTLEELPGIARDNPQEGEGD